MIGIAVTAAAGAVAASAAERPAIVELFTSQGCSSCPPADAMLGELAQHPDLLPLAFHVAYWDYNGWRDSFELPIAAARQARYVQLLDLSMTATPQMIVEAKGDMLGADPQRLSALLGGPRRSLPVELSRDGADLRIKLAAADQVPNCDVILVGYRQQAVTTVTAGENGGQVLREFNIVRYYHPVGTWRGTAAEWRVPLKTLPTDADRAAVLVQRATQREFLGAAIVDIRR